MHLLCNLLFGCLCLYSLALPADLISENLTLIQRDNTSQLTSHYYLGEGIEDVSSDISTLGDQYSDSAQVIDQKSDATIKVTVESAELMLQQNIDSKEEQLQSLEKDISTLETKINISKSCDGIDTCNECTLIDKCVWCSLKKECVPGDRNGPFQEECTEFEYGQCRELGCSQYLGCYRCIAEPSCGWCELGKICTENADRCEYSSFYSLKKEGYTECPQGTIDRNISQMENSKLKAMETSLDNMKTEYKRVKNDLDDLKAEKDELVKLGYEYENLEVSIVDIGDSITDIGEQANERYNNEREENKQTSEEIILSAEDYVNNSTQKMFDSYKIQLDNYEKETVEDMQKFKQEIDTVYNSTKNEIKSDAEEIGSEFLQYKLSELSYSEPQELEYEESSSISEVPSSSSESESVMSFLNIGTPVRSSPTLEFLPEIFHN